MQIIECVNENFDEVRKILRHTQNAFKSGANGRILFNMDECRFEYYLESEIKDINPHAHYGNVEEAMESHNEMEAPLNDIDPIPEPVVFEHDDKDALENAQSILDVISSVKQKVDRENQEKLLKVISDIFKLDTVSESDFIKMIVENAELKKLISYALHMFGVVVSTTEVSRDLQVSTANLKFSPKIEYTIEDYRRGLSQAKANIEKLKTSSDLLVEKEGLIRELERQLALEKKASSESNQQLAVLKEQKDPVRELHPIIPIEYVISFKVEDKIYFITTEKDATPTKDGSYPTKTVNKTKFINKARRFTNSDAKAQVAKMVKFKQNIEFTSLAKVEGKAIQTFFSINRIVIEPAGEVVKFETPSL